jgi:ubiquinone/menaquinone biosynthesis C-methylase UbiE
MSAATAAAAAATDQTSNVYGLPSLPNPLQFYDNFAPSYESSSATLKYIARHLVTLCPSLTLQSVVLDNACGPGIVTGEILDLPAARVPAALHAADFSPKMIEMLRAKASGDHVDAQKWSNVRAVVKDAQNLDGYANNMFTHSFTSFAIFIFPDPVKAVEEIYRTLQPEGGVAVITSWEALGIVAVFQRAVQAVRPDAPAYHGPMSPEWMTDAKLRTVMESGGFKPDDIHISTMSAWMDVSDFCADGNLLYSAMVKAITGGWADDDRIKFEQEIQKELEASVEKRERVEMTAWVAIAQK